MSYSCIRIRSKNLKEFGWNFQPKPSYLTITEFHTKIIVKRRKAIQGLLNKKYALHFSYIFPNVKFSMSRETLHETRHFHLNQKEKKNLKFVLAPI